MSKIKTCNEKIRKNIAEFFSGCYKEKISSPLLVAGRVLEKNRGRILYIGKETNTWCNREINSDKIKITREYLEDKYSEFLENDGKNTLFWKFIKEIVDSEKIADKIVWANIRIIGKKEGRGVVNISNGQLAEEINRISVDYLTYLYKEMNPCKVIIVCGPRNPYYSIVTQFLEKIGVKLQIDDNSDYPTSHHPLVTDKENKIFWTYHPMYLNRNAKYKCIAEKIKNSCNL